MRLVSHKHLQISDLYSIRILKHSEHFHTWIYTGVVKNLVHLLQASPVTQMLFFFLVVSLSKPIIYVINKPIKVRINNWIRGYGLVSDVK